MIDATLCFPVRGNPIQDILLGFKKAGFGKGKYGGFGGKLEPDETIELGTIRELKEESGLIVSENQLNNRGVLSFNSPFSARLESSRLSIPDYNVERKSPGKCRDEACVVQDQRDSLRRYVECWVLLVAPYPSR